MVLNDEQVNRFFDTMDALLYFVNERFHIVKSLTLESSSMIEDVKISMVARELWANTAIIDDFISENPYGLSDKCLEVAEGWKLALPGYYSLVRYQGGRAVLMGEAGVFSVSGVVYELEDEIGPAPAGVEMVLLPFDDLIVYDGFMQAYDIDGVGADQELRRIQDEFEKRCAQGIVSTAAEFKVSAKAYLDALYDQELESLLAGGSDAGELGDADAIPAGFHRGALAGLSGIERELAIREQGEERIEADPELAKMVRQAQQFADERKQQIVEAGDGFCVNSRKWLQALACANGCATLYGVVSVEAAYNQYRALCADAATIDEFCQMLEIEMGEGGEAVYDHWAYDGVDYLVHFTLGSDFIAQRFARNRAESSAGPFRNTETGEIAVPSFAQSDLGYQGDLFIELGNAEQYKRDLVRMRVEVPMKPLPRSVLEQDIVASLLADNTVLALRSFIDERIPDGKDDCSFADSICFGVVLAAVERGDLQELFEQVLQMGLDGCCPRNERLMKLVTNVFNAMPSWENYGWSPQELYEQMTGRKMFYNADGSVMRVGMDDMCPCGSGEKYRDCCGRG